ncbi:Cyclin, N-terminal domain-containing protein [Mycena galopus ATCC 62051]|nr:Cyclin, N-terminal domain-containing protein [Mycena galopus ATCC 62051]
MGVAAGPGSDAAGSSSAAAAGKIKSERAAELEAAGSAKRNKRQALQDLVVRKNVHVYSANGLPVRRSAGYLGCLGNLWVRWHRVHRFKRFWRSRSRCTDFRPGGSAPLSSRPSPIPVRQRDIDVVIDDADTEEVVDLDADADADDTEPLVKRQRTSSVGPEDVLSEAEIADDLAAGAFTSPPPYTSDSADVECAKWGALDAADYDDSMMASEYVADIQRCLKECEVHTRFLLRPETLFLYVSLIDRFLSLRAVAPAKLQLVGLACLLVACKFEETANTLSSLALFVAADADFRYVR